MDPPIQIRSGEEGKNLVRRAQAELVYRALVGACALAAAWAFHLSGIFVGLPIVNVTCVALFLMLVNVPYHVLLARTRRPAALLTGFLMADVVAITYLHALTGRENDLILIIGYILVTIYAIKRLSLAGLYILAISSVVVYSVLLYLDKTYPLAAHEQLQVTSKVFVLARMGLLLVFVTFWAQVVFSRRMKRRADELEITRNELAQRIQTEKYATMGRVAVALAHEINKPNFIIGNLAAIIDEEADRPASVRENVRVISRQSKNIEETVARLMSYARPHRPERSWVDANGLLAELVDAMKRASAGRVRFDLDLSGSLPRIRADEGQLRQVFSNLLVNAIHAIEREGTISVATRELGRDEGGKRARSWRARARSTRRIEIAIGDTGKGIPPENLNRIFDPYFTTRFPGGGAGLGLAICYEIVASHEGKITVGSEVGAGSVFRVVLPVSDGGADGEGAPQGIRAAGTAAPAGEDRRAASRTWETGA